MKRPLRILLLLIVVASVLPTSRAEAHEGWGILVDATGRVYFADIPANIIWRISKEGKLERVALGKHSHALVLDSAGNVYGTNPHLTLPIRSVWRLTPHGQLTDLISPTEHFPLGLQSFIMDVAGSMYSVNARNAQTPELLLLKRNHDGEITSLAGSSVGYADGTGAQARFMGIDGMAWGPDGALYLTDGPYVRRVALDGTVTTLGSGPLTERKWDEDLLGIDVDASGDVYVADHANRRILRVTLAGAVSTFLRTGWLWTPTGVAVAPDGLYVLEHLRMPLAILGDLAVGPYLRVCKVSADGKVTELARIWGRRSVAAGSVMAGVVSVIVGANWFRSRRRPPNTPLQPTSGAGTPSTSNMPRAPLAAERQDVGPTRTDAYDDGRMILMKSGLTRERMIEAIRDLPADASVDDAIERLVFLAKIEEGLAELDRGEGIPHDEVKRRLGL